MYKKITIKIPKGLKNGSKLRIKGEGQIGKFGGENGNLYVIVNIEKDDELNKQKTSEELENKKVLK